MDTQTARGLVDEIAPRVVGATIADVVNPSSDCIVLELAGDRPVFLGAVAMKALPIVFLSERLPGSARRGPALPYARLLRGSRITSFEPLERQPGAVLNMTWTDSTGREVDRTLTVSLGRAPKMGFRDRGTSPSGERPERAEADGGPDATGLSERPGDALPEAAGESTGPTVTWWHDTAGRLHARLTCGSAGSAHEQTRQFLTLTEAACFMFDEFWPVLDLSRRRNALAAMVDRRLRRTRTAMEKVQAEIDDAQGAEDYRRKGQLLVSRQSEVARGSTSVTIRDYDGDEDVTIEIDPKLTPKQNAEALFRKARKAERRGKKAPLRLGELEEKANALEQEAEAIAAASSEELAALEERLSPRKQAPPERRAPAERARFRTYRISGGWEVLVGKSNRDNDILTHKIARPDDLWFHARQVAGSHVVLKKSGGKSQPDKQAILEAAAIAAFHSKAGKSSKVSVCYTEKRHVRKARGGPPGLAVVARESVVMVRPKLPDS